MLSDILPVKVPVASTLLAGVGATSNSLLNGLLASYEDKVYLVADVIQTPSGYDVKFCKNDPVVWLSDFWRIAAGGTGPTVPEMQCRKIAKRSLVSAGVFLWIDQQLVMLKRDAKAPSFAGALTEAAGRCGEMPARTMIKELNEEILMTQGIGKALQTLGLVSNERDTIEVAAIKSKQVGVDASDIVFVQVKPHAIKALPNNVTRIFMDDTLVDTIEGYTWFDSANNTLEIRQSFAIPDSIAVSSIKDGEPYGREVHLEKPENLSGLSLTPCLAWLHESVLCQQLQLDEHANGSSDLCKAG